MTQAADLLYDPTAHEVTHSYLVGDENDELYVDAGEPVSADPRPGHLWVIARRSAHGLTVHLIDLAGQSDVEWNRGKHPSRDCTDVQVRLRWPRRHSPGRRPRGWPRAQTGDGLPPPPIASPRPVI